MLDSGFIFACLMIMVDNNFYKVVKQEQPGTGILTNTFPVTYCHKASAREGKITIWTHNGLNVADTKWIFVHCMYHWFYPFFYILKLIYLCYFV